MSLFTYPKNRIAILDGFRTISIVAVMLFHYLVAYTPEFTSIDLYPYHDKYTHIFLLRNGRLGVQFFFIISGFVIFMTLENTQSIKQFIIKRFIRLWPTLLICSIISFTFLNTIVFYQGLRGNIYSFLPTLTITQPYTWNRLFNLNAYYVDGVEWSLVVEVSFYALSSVIYFLNKKRFFNNWLIFIATLLSIHFVCEKFNWLEINKWFDFTVFPLLMVYFTAGMYFYLLYAKRKVTLLQHLTAIALVAIQLVFLQNFSEDIFIVSFLILFLLFLYSPRLISFMGNRVIAQIGLWSYTIYLIHNWIGVTLINKFSVLVDTISPLPTITLSVLVIAALTIAIENLSLLLNKQVIKPMFAKFQQAK